MKIESWAEEELVASRSKLRILRGIAFTLIVLPCLAFGGGVGYCVASWRGNSEAARCVAGNGYAPNADRVQALVGMRRDLDLSIALLKQMAQEPDEIGQQSRLLLEHAMRHIKR